MENIRYVVLNSTSLRVYKIDSRATTIEERTKVIDYFFFPVDTCERLKEDSLLFEHNREGMTIAPVPMPPTLKNRGLKYVVSVTSSYQ